MKSVRRVAALAALCGLLTACGGGGGGGDNGPAYSVNVAPGSVQFSARARGALPAAQEVTATFRGDGLVVGLPPGVTAPAWLNVSVVGSPSASPVQVRFTPTSVSSTAAALSTTVRFTSGKADGSQVVTQDVTVSYAITDPLEVSVTRLDFDGVAGSAQGSSQTFDVIGSGFNWTASTTQPWLTLSSTSGSNAAAIQVTATAATLAVGDYTAEVRVADATNNTVRTIPVAFQVASNRWNAARIGVQLLEFSDSDARPAEVKITNDGGANVSWTATANVPWVTVTPTDTNGATLVIEPNAAADALSEDIVQIGTVMIEGAGLAGDMIRVGYYRSSAPEPDEVHARIGIVDAIAPEGGIVADPVRPYAYIALTSGTVRRINLLTGAVDTVLTAPGPAGSNTRLAKIVMSGEGRFLYVAHPLVASGGGILRLDLDADPASLTTLPRQTTECCVRDIAWLRTRGVQLVVSRALEVYNAVTGVVQPPGSVQPGFIQPGNLEFQFVNATRDGSEIWTFAQPVSNLVNDGCNSGVSYRMNIRSATGEGFLTPWRTQAPSIAGSAECPSLRQFASTVGNDTWRAIGRISMAASAIYSGPAGQPMTQLGAPAVYGQLAVRK